MVTVTQEFIKKYAFKADGGVAINSSQCVILGLNFTDDLKSGWLSKFETIQITNASAALFKRLKGLAKNQQREEIERFKREKAKVQKSLF